MRRLPEHLCLTFLESEHLLDGSELEQYERLMHYLVLCSSFPKGFRCGFLTNPHVSTLGPIHKRRLFILYFLQGVSALDEFDQEEVASVLDISIEELQDTKKTLIEAGLMDEHWNLANIFLTSREVKRIFGRIEKGAFSTDELNLPELAGIIAKASGLRNSW